MKASCQGRGHNPRGQFSGMLQEWPWGRYFDGFWEAEVSFFLAHRSPLAFTRLNFFRAKFGLVQQGVYCYPPSTSNSFLQGRFGQEPVNESRRQLLLLVSRVVAMASQTTSQSSERNKMDQIVAEFYAKSLHIILDSRIPSLSSQNYLEESHHSAASSSPRSKSTNKWFNLEMENCAAVAECAEPWKRGCLEPMTVDILLQQPSSELPSPSSFGGGGLRYYKGTSPGRENISGDSWTGDIEGCASPGGLCRTILERWVIHYTGRKKSVGGGGGGGSGGSKTGTVGSGEGVGISRGAGGGAPLPYPSSHAVESPVVYKRTVIMLRSLYCTMRTLPSHRLFRLVNSSHHSRSFSLSYRVSASPPPLSESDQAAMMNNSFGLTPIETMWGRMCISVNYRHTTAVTALEITPPMEPRIITDYVGSPHTNPIRKFHSVGSVPSGGISGRRGVHVVSLPSSVPSSPSGPSFDRRHSWSSGQAKMHLQQPLGASPSFRSSRSPSPSVATDFNPSSSPAAHSASPSHNLHLQLSPRTSPSRPSLPRQYSSQPSSFHQVGHGHPSQPIPIAEHGRSPPFSASPSPSPPTHYSAPRSAPVSIPRPSSGRTYLSSSPRRLEGPTHTRSPYPPPSAGRTLDNVPRSLSSASKQWTVAGTNVHVPNLEGKDAPPRLSISDWAVNSSLLLSPAHPFRPHQVTSGDDKVDEGPPSGLKRSLYAPPRLLLPSRGMSKVETVEDADDEEFSCPFAVDDEEAESYRSRMDSPKVRQSSDTFEAVGQVHQRSQDAAVGALVRILKAAPPLRPWNMSSPVVSGSPNLRASPPVAPLAPADMLGGKVKSSPPRPTTVRSRSGTTSLVGSPVSQALAAKVTPKTSGSALEELRSYMEMRDHLQRQSGVKLASSPAKHL
ncbi:hypothetical protein R1sor_001095 [Riccia sorocarpa]|uniref:Autophagy-related protein 13 N-terminal domain-containing protein n=1 Tax=Riccia sorocarpa TaxID=122646 RepID=A0ABD3GV13_9MARC